MKFLTVSVSLGNRDKDMVDCEVVLLVSPQTPLVP